MKHNMSGKVYPDMQKICRLCLKENEGTVCIFPKEKSSLDKFSSLSIPMRIMTCASLEVQDCDDLPKKVCIDCRLQLEKSYYFRKMCQASDTKLRKHIRLLSMGKVSKVFAKNLHGDDDDDENELKFKDSLEFIKEQEDRRKQEEYRKCEEKINDIKLQYELELETTKETLKSKCQEELEPLIREEIRKDLRIEIQNELEEKLRQEITDECLHEAKELVRNEVHEECRQLEIKSLLEDLQTYLTNRKISLEENLNKISSMRSIKTDKKKESQAIRITPKLEYVEMELQNQREEKENTTIQDVTEEEQHINDDECDSDGNLSTYDTDEVFDVQKKLPSNSEGYHANNDLNDIEYDDDEMENTTEVMENNEESQGITATSYRIDNESGEIQFLKKSENFNNELDEENLDQSSYEDIMIIKLADNMGEDYIEEFEDAKCTISKEQPSPKPVEQPENNTKVSVQSTVSISKTKAEATVVTKAYVNPMQRNTDTPKIFRCNDCPVVFSTKHSLERHLRTHKKVKMLGVTFQCPECRIVVSCSSALRRHMYIHSEEKPFSCNLCEKSFVQKEILKRHMITHTGIKPHQCPHCERAFAQRINLTQHINRNHLEEPRIRQHSCHLCPKRFNHASGLSRHLTSHRGVAFHCSECDRTFGDRSSIKRHIANMHTNAKTPKNQNK